MGRASTSSGAEISMRISCWVMCTQNNCSPSSWSGESRAITSEIQPSANESIGKINDFRLALRRNIFAVPRPKRAAVSNNEIAMKGGHVQSVNSSWLFSVSDDAGDGERTAAAPMTASCIRFTDISFTGTENPAWDPARNDHYGKRETECHS